MQILFSIEIEQRAYEEQPQGFEEYQKETFVCRWKKVENLQCTAEAW
jgi:hypothetical protein